jgi:hypothetical protein
VGNVRITDDGAHLQFTRGAANYIHATSTGGEFYFTVNGSSDTSAAMVIKSTNNVGIGTTTPKSKLEINNTTAYDGTESNFAADSLVLYGSVGGADTQYYGGITWANASRRRAGIASVMENSDADHVGIAFFTQGTDGSGPMAESMRIARSGNVGIGTKTPGYKLDVNGTLRAYGITDSSDRRLKTDISLLEGSEEGISCLQGVTYHWIDPKRDPDLQIGLIAQDVEQCFPELVETDPSGYKSVAYSRLVVPLIETAKLQRAALDEQESLNHAQQQRLQAQQQELNRLALEQAELKAKLAHLEALVSARK